MICIRQSDSAEGKEQILSRLVADNRERCAWLRENPAFSGQNDNFLLYDGEELIGGAIGYIAFNWYYLDLLHIKKEYRGGGWGGKLLKEAERFAARHDLTGIRLETWEFQAREFYEKHGFTVFGELDDYPPGVKYFFMKKTIEGNHGA